MTDTPPAAPCILVDADACPVKDEVYRVALRHGLKTYVVANSFINVPREPLIARVLVPQGLDVADDWIAARAGPGIVVITADVPLAHRCVSAGAEAIAPDGKAFTTGSIGMALATRDLMTSLREAGAVTGGPRPFSPRDRSAFLQALDRAVMRLKRAGWVAPPPA
ncbi:YaiI/YqxD family protein [Enterovirga sp.]|uniref:YaiI/YqxD family protein n=1 Tax=Enterovirga sp. TaxID=2026350 RepID=UPI0026345C31|nr:YaiI/YqxD family protein [Enterovirga sp.]